MQTICFNCCSNDERSNKKENSLISKCGEHVFCRHDIENWLKNHKSLTITKARESNLDSLIDQYNDWRIDEKYRDKRSFKARTGVNYNTFRSWVIRNTGKKMKQLSVYEKEDLVIDFKAEKGLL